MAGSGYWDDSPRCGGRQTELRRSVVPMPRKYGWALAALLLAAAPGPLCFAQDSLLDDLYGRGVHAFFARNYPSAHELFTAAIKGGSRDPRAYYFRGLVYSRLGRP